MGEYAIRKSDRTEIKIGTCGEMFYIRYEDRDKVTHKPGSINASQELNLFWRLPFPDEDEIAIGEYGNHQRGQRLYTESDKYGDDLELSANPGIIQLRHESGLLLNVPCYHGKRLPEVTKPMQAFWNGKSWSLELTSIKNTTDGVKPVVSCRHCNSAWRFEWAEIMPYLHGKMKQRLSVYAQVV
jgi:hypothetical protein